MRLGNAGEAKAASEQIGTAHRFVVSQLTDTVGDSVSDTASYSYTSTVGTADSVAVSASASQVQRAGPRARPVLVRVRGVRAAYRVRAPGEQLVGGESASRGRGRAAATRPPGGCRPPGPSRPRASAARTRQRSREFLVEQHELQQLPPSGDDRQLRLAGRPPGGVRGRQSRHPDPADGHAGQPGRGPGAVAAGQLAGRPGRRTWGRRRTWDGRRTWRPPPEPPAGAGDAGPGPPPHLGPRPGRAAGQPRRAAAWGACAFWGSAGFPVD